MTALLTEHLPLLAGAPNGIKKLRELIRDLAVIGRLVPPDADCMAWHWSTLGNEIKGMDSGWSPACLDVPSLSSDEWAVLRTTSVQPLRYLQEENKLLPPNLVPRPEMEVRTGDVLFTRAGPMNRVGISCLVDSTRPKLMLSDKIIRFQPIAERLDGRFTALCLNAGATARYIEGAKSGMAASQVNISQSKLKAAPIPVPPIKEQHRIVAKVNELMALCDRLEARQADADSAHAQLVEALLGSLTQSRDANDFATSWQRLSNHFHTLFTTESSIDALKQAVLQLAVMGKLVPQNPRNEHAIELLKDIQSSRADKRNIVTLGDVPSSKRIPDCWAWSSVDQLSADDPRAISDGPFGASLKTEHYIDSPGFRVVRLQNIGNGEFRDEHRAYISSDHFEKITKHQVFSGDLVVAGLIDASIRCCLVPKDIGPAVVKADCYRFSTHPSVSRNYMLYYLNSKAAHVFAAIHHHGLTLTRIGLGNFRSIPVPLPPMEEQHRIVAKVDQLIGLCDQLKSRMEQARELSQELTKAMIEKALEAGPASRSYREMGGEVVHLASYLVSKMSASPTFGRVALMKGIYLADQHLGLDLVDEYERMAAGPFTDEVYEVEQSAAERDWFSHARMKSDKDRVIYKPGKNITQATDVLRDALGEARAELDRLIALLANKATDSVEMIATLYAVWADASAKGVPIDDDLLVHEVRNHWHESKLRFPPQTLKHWLAWMRENQLVPSGTKPHGGRQSRLKLA